MERCLAGYSRAKEARNFVGTNRSGPDRGVSSIARTATRNHKGLGPKEARAFSGEEAPSASRRKRQANAADRLGTCAAYFIRAGWFGFADRLHQCGKSSARARCIADA